MSAPLTTIPAGLPGVSPIDHIARLRAEVERCRIQYERAFRMPWLFRHDVQENADLELWSAERALARAVAEGSI